MLTEEQGKERRQRNLAVVFVSAGLLIITGLVNTITADLYLNHRIDREN